MKYVIIVVVDGIVSSNQMFCHKPVQIGARGFEFTFIFIFTFTVALTEISGNG